MSDRLLTLDQVAERLQLGRTTVSRLTRSGTLPTVRLAPRVPRVRESALDAYISKLSTPTED